MFARVAVDVDQPEIDRLYDYALSAQQAQLLRPGMRVIVPFGRGNRKREGMAVLLTSESSLGSVKMIESIVDDEPVLGDELLKLALHMRSRLGCTFYSIVHAMLPSGLWYRRNTSYSLSPSFDGNMPQNGEYREFFEYLGKNPGAKASAVAELISKDELLKLVKKGIIKKTDDFLPSAKEKTETVYALTRSGRQFDLSSIPARRAPSKSAVIEFLSRTESANTGEIRYYTGASASVVSSMYKQGLIEKTERRVWRKPDVGIYHGQEIVLNDEQTAAADGLRALADEPGSHTALLFGVTGSGKTEVYINLIHHVLASGGDALLLVPEISLTPQFTARFMHEFGQRVAVLHSALPLGERYDEFCRIKNAEVDVVVGTRSAVFAPLENLKLIIIDEEHEPSYKSESEPRYHALDAARYRAMSCGALLLLGSATPSIDTAYHAKNGDYAYFSLDHRAKNANPAAVLIADRREAYRHGYKGNIGPELAMHLARVLENGEQAVLFLNRRGTSRSVQCLSCGHVPMCINCSSALSYHQASRRLMCHLCGYSEPMPDVCPACGSEHMERIGSGTQSVEQELYDAFPGIRVLRMDSDTTRSADAHESILSRFASGEADVLVGTQMIAKGLDFPKVTLSAVIDADMSLYTGDFRACERTFSLITQVVGRSGRADRQGYAVIQTSSPENDVIKAAACQDYWAFYSGEIELRRQLELPPAGQLVRFTVSAPIENDAAAGAERLVSLLGGYLEGAYSDLDMTLLGPAPAPTIKVNNRFFYTVYVKSHNDKRARQLLSGALLQFRRDAMNRKIKVYFDINL